MVFLTLFLAQTFRKVVCTIKILPCTLNPLRVGCQHSLVCPTNKNIFLHNHGMTIKIQEMNVDTLYYVILRPRSSFATCPGDVL